MGILALLFSFCIWSNQQNKGLVNEWPILLMFYAKISTFEVGWLLASDKIVVLFKYEQFINDGKLLLNYVTTYNIINAKGFCHLARSLINMQKVGITRTKMIYCTWENFGGGKFWRIWRTTSNSPKFSPPIFINARVFNELPTNPPNFSLPKTLEPLIRQNLPPPKFSHVRYIGSSHTFHQPK